VRRALSAELAQGADLAGPLAAAEHLLLEAIEEHDRLCVLAVGRPEEEGCYCKLNALLRVAVETLGRRFPLVLVDAEAGVEQVNRRAMRAVSHLLLVTDLSVKGLHVAEEIRAVAARTSDARRVGLLVNRARPDEAAALGGRTSLPLLGAVPEDAAIRAFDAEPRSLLELPSSTPALCAVRAAVLEGELGAGLRAPPADGGSPSD
jgi:CO dehydrogenase maturation factor